MNLNHKKYWSRVALIWAGYLVLSFLVYMIVLAPQRKKRNVLEEKALEAKQIYDSALIAARKETKMRIYKQIEYLRNGWKEFVMDSENSDDLTFDISQIANEGKNDSFRIKDKHRSSALPNCNHICENHIDISFTAGFNQFATFLNSLERYRPVIFVDKFTIVRSDKADLIHKVNMSLSTFIKKSKDG